MNLDEIETFVAIAQLGGFARAAGHLHRSQPAVSRRVKLLEEELNAPLLERLGSRVVLTEAGRAFLPFAEAALAILRDGVEAVSVAREGIGGTVSLALVGTLAATDLVNVLKAFVREHATVRLDLRTANSREVSDLVRRGEVTLGLRYFTDGARELETAVVGYEAMVPVAPADHRLATAGPIEAEELRAERWVGFGLNRGGRETFAHVLHRWLAAAGLDEAQVVVVDSLTAQKRLVEAGFGLALLPVSAIGEELRSGTIVVLDAPTFATTVPVVLVQRRSGFLNPAARALLALIEARAATAVTGCTPS
ncbi:LysR family transcriptional regulator [Salinarimonas soli]|uniref:LysR family transcriptional regulator n=1 Tax=Salinarimonas soli TaxID=1638099 RepID=A0A5B2VQV3_9HYPH|nr:LysR family transcriptional regulator [Salinarimonas soli]KAA2242143.1 LysR family transcriptional regulator [Salinarimonas soli]